MADLMTKLAQGWNNGSVGNALGNIAKATLTFHVAGQDEEGHEVGNDYQMAVQYNPASIRFQANAQPMPFKYLQNNVDTSIPTQRTRNASIVMSVDLIFDDTNLKDAFMADRLRLSASDVASDVSSLVSDREYSVMPQTNAILAALLRDSTRSVTFQWADLSFDGELTEAQASYTMFSLSGQPIRSTISLNIAQELQKPSKAMGKDKLEKSFDKVFGSADSLTNAASAGTVRQTQNLLNFNL